MFFRVSDIFHVFQCFFLFLIFFWSFSYFCVKIIFFIFSLLIISSCFWLISCFIDNMLEVLSKLAASCSDPSLIVEDQCAPGPVFHIFCVVVIFSLLISYFKDSLQLFFGQHTAPKVAKRKVTFYANTPPVSQLVTDCVAKRHAQTCQFLIL